MRASVILKGVCLAYKTDKAKNKIILFLCFMSCFFLLLRKRGNITKSHQASQTSVILCMNWDGCRKLQSPGKVKGRVGVLRALWV